MPLCEVAFLFTCTNLVRSKRGEENNQKGGGVEYSQSGEEFAHDEKTVELCYNANVLK